MSEPIIGRRADLQALAGFVEALPRGGQALLIEGDAGIGKTVLWHEGVRTAQERGIRLLSARAAHGEMRIAFTTIGDLIAPTLDEALPLLPLVQRRALEIAMLRRDPDGPPPETRVLGLAVASIIRSLAREQALLIALDDVQWVDASSAVILRFALRRLEGEAVGVLATVRGRPDHAPLDLDRAFATFGRLPVGPLSIGALHRLLWGRLSLTLSRPALVRVHDTTGGNPFYALELGRALADGAISLDGGHVPLPASLERVVASRLDALPARVRDTLVAVAALAAPTVLLLEALTPSAVADAELARKRGLLEFDGDRIRFTHPLLAPSCYTTMPLHRRRRLHRRLAALDVDPEERARHLAIAAAGPDEEIAAALEMAATLARARGAAQAAAELGELAVILTPQRAVDDVSRRRVSAADDCAFAGDAGKASELLEDAIRDAEPGPARALALSRLASVRWVTHGFRVVEDLFDRALAEPGLEGRERANVLRALAWMTAAGRGSVDGVRHAEAALRLDEDVGDPVQLAASLATVAELTFWRTGRIRHDLLDRAIELEPAHGGHGGVHWTLARLLGRADRFGEARAVWARVIAADMARADPDVVGAMMFLARMEVAAGAWEAASRLCEEAIELAQQTGRDQAESLCLMILAEIDAYRGEAEKARRTIPDLLPVAAGVGYSGATYRLTRALASLELSCGHAAASWRLTAPLLTDVTELDEVLAQLAGSVGIEALIGLGNLSEAERLLSLLGERAAESDTALEPLAGRCRGLLVDARGDHEQAIELLEQAAVEPEPPQEANPFEQARTLLALGTVQRRAQHKRAARESLRRSTEIFDRLGARSWLERARSELQRIGGRTAVEGELSETERRIVELVVAGRRNREVAAELSLSPNTVAWNLSKVYRKLGVGSRTELAAHMTARG